MLFLEFDAIPFIKLYACLFQTRAFKSAQVILCLFVIVSHFLMFTLHHISLFRIFVPHKLLCILCDPTPADPESALTDANLQFPGDIYIIYSTCVL